MSKERKDMEVNGMDFLRRLVYAYGWRDEWLNDNKSPKQLCDEFLLYLEGKTDLDGNKYKD